MSYIIIERFGGVEHAAICTDENGNNLVFENREAAETDATDCQDGLVVEM
jgi:hypothetical protein